MKKLHKLLYSLFGFFVCGFGAHAANTVSGKASDYTLRPFSGLSTTHDFFCCKVEPGVPCSSNMTTGQCSNDGCYSLSNYGVYDSATVSYASVWGLNLYGCEVVAQGCYSNSRGFNGSACENCKTGYLSTCSSPQIHQYTCGAACAAGYFYDSESQTCELCPSYNTKTENEIYTKYGTTKSCNPTTSAVATKCYITNVSNGYDKATGDSYEISSGMCMYQS